MDSGIWLHDYDTTNASGNNGSMCGYAASSCTPGEFQYMEDDEQQQFLISSQVQHDLNHQISMPMNMDVEAAAWMSSNYGATTTIDDTIDPIMEGLLDDPLHRHHASTGISFPSSSSSASLCSLETSSTQSQILTVPAGGGLNQHQYPAEITSHLPLLLPPPPPVVLPPPYAYDHHRYTTPPEKTAGGAFKLYAWYLGPKRPPPKPGACGQRMFKTAMSVLFKMHVAACRYNQQQQQYNYQAAADTAAGEAAPQPPSSIQLQHMFSERKRRDKLNDGFDALKAVLPPGAKKDKASILMRARECVRSLEAKVAELEEKNKSLKSRLTRGGDHDSSETTTTTKVQVEVEITRAAANEEGERDLCTLRIAVRSPSSSSPPCNNMTDVVVRTLQCLKDQIGEGVSLVAMSTSGGDDGGGIGTTTGVNKNTSSRAVLTLQIKSPGTDWEEQPVKDAVAKVVADTLTTTTTTLPGHCHPRRPPPTAAAASAMLLNSSSVNKNKRIGLMRGRPVAHAARACPPPLTEN